MSLYDYQVVRVGSQLMAYVEIQNEYTGQTVKSLKKVYNKEFEYYIRADGRIHNITNAVNRLLQQEEKIKKAPAFMTVMEVIYMDNYKTTQELLASKGLTAKQSLHILDGIEICVDQIIDELHQQRDDLMDLEFTDDSCNKYYEEDVCSIYNKCSSKIIRSLRQIEVIIRSAKEDMRDDT